VHRGFAPPRVEDVVTNAGGVVDLDSELSWIPKPACAAARLEALRLPEPFSATITKNQIVAASIASGTAFTNGGKTLQQGFEFTGQIDSERFFARRITFISARLILFCRPPNFSASVSARLPRLRFCSSFAGKSSYTNHPDVETMLDNGNRLPYAPETQLTSSLGYSHPVGVDAL
jgi:Fe(3+) dicitrate transport protein